MRRDWRLRDAVMRALMVEARPEDRPLMRWLVDREIEEHKQHDGLSDDMIICTYLLANERQVEDARRLWEAKATNFSTWLGLSVVLVAAGGVDETIAFWKKGFVRRWRRPATTALDVIKHARADGRLADLDGPLAKIRTYCENSLKKSGP